MKLTRFGWLPAILLVLITLVAPQRSRAEDIIVEHNPTAGHFGTIQAAIDQVHSRLIQTPTASFRILVTADKSTPYIGQVTIKDSNVPIIGSNTSETILTGASPVISATGIASVGVMSNFTIRSASIGISLNNSHSATIRNIVFDTVGTGILLQTSVGDLIVNDTFFNNTTAIANSTGSTLTVTNNIFANNTGILSNPGLASLSYNDYFPNHNGIATLDPQSIPNTAHLNANPLFVDTGNKDFHLQSISPAIGTGNPTYLNSGSNTSDMGAYGGPFRDIPVPETVTGVTATSTVAGGLANVTLSWSPTTNTQVTAYRVYYGSASRVYNGTQAQEGPSPIKVTTTGATLTGIPVVTPATPGVPQNVTLTPSNGALQVSWSAVPGATGYQISYTVSGGTPSTFNVNAATSATITGLTNGSTYSVTVTALAQQTVFAAVTAVIDPNVASNPGSLNESSFSVEQSQGISPVVAGSASAPVSGIPEAVVATPDLKGGGCFIATAAYGFYSAPQVQALRDFRDRYLLTNAPGRAFVAWYYHYGPKGARYMNLHPWLKAPVRLVLLPLIVAALFLTGSSMLVKATVGILALLLFALRLRAWRPGRRRQALAGKFLLMLLMSLPVVFPSPSRAAEQPRPDRPHWSLEIKGGVEFPEAPNWAKSYGSSYTGEYGGAIAYKVLRQLEVGLAGSYSSASGSGILPRNNIQSGNVTIRRAPLDVFVLGRGLFYEDQLLVPYLSAGYTRLFYREEVQGQGSTEGSVNGFHVRGGLQFLLDRLERGASQSLYEDFGIHHTYFFVEGKYLHATADTTSSGSINLGGPSVLGGFLFEF